MNRFLLEEGCPKVNLTDNGLESSSKLLRELMRLCRTRLKYTPPYHPRGNYTERAAQTWHRSWWHVDGNQFPQIR